MKFFMYSQSGEGAQVLHKIKLEGNDVGIYIKDKHYKNVFDGILPKVNPHNFVDKDTIILFDMSGNGSIADQYKKDGHKVFGASEFADKLENDRKFGYDMMEKAGIKIPVYKQFHDFRQGEKYVRETNGRLVFKPSGSMPCKLTYCAGKHDPVNELIEYLHFVERKFSKHINSFVLQEFIDGCVISSEFFVTRFGFVWPPNHTIEVKKSMNDDLGPSTGCSGNIAWAVGGDKIIKEGVLQIEDICIENDYIGQIDLNAVVNENGVFGLEWTPRFGYDSIPVMMSLLEMDFGQFFADIVNNTPKHYIFSEDYAGGVRVTIPPYPAEPEEGADVESFSPNEGVPIQDFEDHIQNLYLYEVCMDHDILTHSSGTGVIACAVNIDSDCEKVLDYPYQILEDLVLPDKQYRTDLNKVLPKMLKEAMEYA
jgi:phosphoribosylamine---glycine ligase